MGGYVGGTTTVFFTSGPKHPDLASTSVTQEPFPDRDETVCPSIFQSTTWTNMTPTTLKSRRIDILRSTIFHKRKQVLF